MPNIPPLLPDPFQRAAWHMRNGSGSPSPFWRLLADFIESAGHQLASAGGKWSMCDEPASVHTADELAQAYLAGLPAAALAEIPQGLHS